MILVFFLLPHPHVVSLMKVNIRGEENVKSVHRYAAQGIQAVEEPHDEGSL